MVLNNVAKFHKILIKSIRFRERTSSAQTYVRKYIRTDRQGLHLMPQPLSWRGHNKTEIT